MGQCGEAAEHILPTAPLYVRTPTLNRAHTENRATPGPCVRPQVALPTAPAVSGLVRKLRTGLPAVFPQATFGAVHLEAATSAFAVRPGTARPRGPPT